MCIFFIFPQRNYIFDAKELFNQIKLNDNYNRPLYSVFMNQDFDFNHSNILDRENDMLMKYESTEQTIKWSNRNETIVDMYDWEGFRGEYSVHYANYVIKFNYTKRCL